MNELFPIFIKAHETPILIIGGGEVAEEKLHFLLKSSPHARVKVVAKELTPGVISFLDNHPNLIVARRAFEPEDLKGKKLVIVAANNPELLEEVKALSEEHDILMNSADNPPYCDFYLGGIVTKGNLKIAISTNGKAPIIAKRLREFFELNLPDNLEENLEVLETLRRQLTGDFEKKLSQLNELTKELIENDQYRN
ncbi:MAG: bifunctional precorrin-2 dehydrogenase/sirohydrochlorin ferrochelatase [Crocinitomicaceae bacterium]|nr:bifunctional precorrin-2 dehydrogenase/sirohydrochlorin ferrochelatase [Crocinitomicaceae bacterium]